MADDDRSHMWEEHERLLTILEALYWSDKDRKKIIEFQGREWQRETDLMPVTGEMKFWKVRYRSGENIVSKLTVNAWG